MPEHLKALIVIFVLSSCVFALAKAPACAQATSPENYLRRRNLWLGITFCAFMAHNFWLYIVVVGTLLLIALARETNPLALFFFLLFAVPPISAEISGLGVINYFMEMDYLRLLALVILLPTYLSLRKQAGTVPFGLKAADCYLAAYLVLIFVLQLMVDTATDSLRYALYSFLGAFLPYYVASRLPRDLAAFRDAIMAFVIASMLIALIAIFEFGKHWLLYATLDDTLGQKWNMSNYLLRGDSLRALASVGHPIVLGYLMLVAIGFHLFLKKSLTPKQWLLGVLLLFAGLLAPVSRGPWVGAVFMLIVFIATGPRPWQSFAKLGILGLLSLPLVLVTPLSAKIINYLPFVGTVDASNVTYRQQLIEVSLEVIEDNLWFGSSDFLLDPRMQQLMQGEKIIDMVNSYLGFALASGLIGLGLLCLFFGSIAIGILREMRRLPDKEDELYLLGRALLATLLGVLVTIFTVSSILAIPIVYWSISGLGAAYIGMLVKRRSSAAIEQTRAVNSMALSN